MCAAGSSEKIFSNTAKYVKCAKYIKLKYFKDQIHDISINIVTHCCSLLLLGTKFVKKVDFEQNYDLSKICLVFEEICGNMKHV